MKSTNLKRTDVDTPFKPPPPQKRSPTSDRSCCPPPARPGFVAPVTLDCNLYYCRGPPSSSTSSRGHSVPLLPSTLYSGQNDHGHTISVLGLYLACRSISIRCWGVALQGALPIFEKGGCTTTTTTPGWCYPCNCGAYSPYTDPASGAAGLWDPACVPGERAGMNGQGCLW